MAAFEEEGKDVHFHYFQIRDYKKDSFFFFLEFGKFFSPTGTAGFLFRSKVYKKKTISLLFSHLTGCLVSFVATLWLTINQAER